MRINRYLSYCGVCSRREADRLVEKGQVLINGRTAGPGDQVTEEDTVTAGGRSVHPPKERVYLALYKPYGVICSFAEKEKNSLRQFTSGYHHISYAGRLDVRSEGLLLLTDDGDLIHALMTGRYGHEKEYVVITQENVSEEQLEILRNGMFLPDLKKNTRPCKAWKTAENEFHIVLTQGMNRQIRRMCETVGLQVKQLKRIRIENIRIGSMRPGEIRTITKEELTELQKRVSRQE